MLIVEGAWRIEDQEYGGTLLRRASQMTEKQIGRLVL